ncbi:TyrR/PhhR family helix-turn-helix DNA-binding protein [Biformimicrobium ophioploci]|uniref:HTH-type transcriptional regulatory protein TyrR n=1 Tax=Biformimicrobium ophioploci TaxID=3036711 RepID=A0ABQ6M1H5_9GAMM|nr:TyrR/PhhR family helix-turn-helix DNA-binding protein [Microbulbifer sp. NKW57]GMG88137.1 sigma-54-dependent phenylalanine hydroxylase transcriptional regulator PhhR [Microbulbifer sp. NKW57]
MAIFADFRINVTSGELGGEDGSTIYLHAPGLLQAQFRSIERAVLGLEGVRAMRRVTLMPSERRAFELNTLLDNLEDPVLSVNRSGQVLAANLAAARAFGFSLDKVAGIGLERFLPGVEVRRMLKSLDGPRFGMPVSLRGHAFIMSWTPIGLPSGQGASDGSSEGAAGAVITLRRRHGEPADFVEQAPQRLWSFGDRRTCCESLVRHAREGGPVLIIGEPGSGRTVLARQMFYLNPAHSRSGARLFYLNLAEGEMALPRGSLARGAAGVLVLDNAGPLSDAAQAALLAQLDKVARGISIITTSALPLTQQEYSPALMARLEGRVVELPALRFCRSAIIPCVEAMLDDRGGGFVLSAAAAELVRSYDWPGNFTQLQAVVDAAIEAAHGEISGGGVAVEILPRHLSLPRQQADFPWLKWLEGRSLKAVIEQVECSVLRALQPQFSSTRALAERLGTSHTAIAKRLKKYKL